MPPDRDESRGGKGKKSDGARAADASLRGCQSVALGAKPGITGLAQVRGRNLVGPGRKSRLDAFYAANWSWALEGRIIRDTIIYVLTGKGVV